MGEMTSGIFGWYLELPIFESLMYYVVTGGREEIAITKRGVERSSADDIRPFASS